MNIGQLRRFGDLLSKKIELFESITNDCLVKDEDLVINWLKLSNAVHVFRKNSARQKGENMIFILRYNDENPLVARYEQTIHRIMLNPVMANLVCVDEEIARVTEGKIELALFAQEFDEALPSIVDGLARSFTAKNRS